MARTAASSCDCESAGKWPDLCRAACRKPCCSRIGLSSLPSTCRRTARFTRRSSHRSVTSTVMLKGSPQRSTRSQMQHPGPSRLPSAWAPSPPPAATRSSPVLTKKTQLVSLPRFAGTSPTSKICAVDASLMASSCRAERPSSMPMESRKARLLLTRSMTEVWTTRLKNRASAAQTPTPGRVATTEALLGRLCSSASSPKARPLGI
mmetsp:Transcript_5840/g.18418  ORF Transcript_5840/g.18418 Transcript_5840/m.18418 type:complete len:206 (-) Transcript_5840:76-693(-)